MQKASETYSPNIRLTECSRDAMQGIDKFIPTEKKVEYLNSLLKVGYDILDFGSFVSPKAIPQLADTAKVLDGLDLSETKSKLLAIVGNLHGAKNAVSHEQVSFLGFPFSVSNTFLKLNLNIDIKKAFEISAEMLELCDKKNKTLRIYLSMGFGNPYNDPWSIELVAQWVENFRKKGASSFTISDIVANSNTHKISSLYSLLNSEFPNIDFGFHLHTKQDNWHEKIDAAYNNGCHNFDAVLQGRGGCPMTGMELVENLKMNNLIEYLDSKKIEIKINREAQNKAFSIAETIFD